MFIKKTVRLVIVLFCSLGIFSAAAGTQDPNSEKRLVFHKFLQVIGAEAQYNQMMNIMAGQLQSGFASGLRQQVQQIDDASPEERAKFLGIMEGALGRFVSTFKARVMEKMPFSGLIDELYYPVYERHFNTSEFREIIAFYESPVGKKFVSLAPNLMQESVFLFNKLYGQRLQEVSNSIAKEEFERIKPELEKLKHK